MKPEKAWVERYIKSKENAWSETTRQSEGSRLLKVVELLDGNPETLWEALEEQEYGNYSKATIWTRVSCFWDWCNKEGLISAESGNPYRSYRTSNARLFKNVYKRSPSRLSFDEIKSRIAQISHKKVRNKALELLTSGLRYTESLSKEDGNIVGKGGKVREFLGDQICDWDLSYSFFYMELKKVGLSPHDLRKAFATRMVESGMNPYDLCRVMGWSKLETAMSYVQTSKRDELKDFIKKATK